MLLYRKRKDALAAGDTEYFSRRTCPRGHVGNRYVSDGRCCECVALEAWHRLQGEKAKGQK